MIYRCIPAIYEIELQEKEISIIEKIKDMNSGELFDIHAKLPQELNQLIPYIGVLIHDIINSDDISKSFNSTFNLMLKKYTNKNEVICLLLDFIKYIDKMIEDRDK